MPNLALLPHCPWCASDNIGAPYVAFYSDSEALDSLCESHARSYVLAS